MRHTIHTCDSIVGIVTIQTYRYDSNVSIVRLNRTTQSTSESRIGDGCVLPTHSKHFTTSMLAPYDSSCSNDSIDIRIEIWRRETVVWPILFIFIHKVFRQLYLPRGLGSLLWPLVRIHSNVKQADYRKKKRLLASFTETDTNQIELSPRFTAQTINTKTNRRLRENSAPSHPTPAPPTSSRAPQPP